MAHQSQRDFLKTIGAGFPIFFHNAKVLEIGSLNINGTVRDFFSNCDYTGIDVAAGKDVDIVCQGQQFNADTNSFDHVISCEAMEHNPYWKETLVNMIRVCRPGGLVTMTCATIGRPEHGTKRTSPSDSPLTIEQGWDYYQNLKSIDFTQQCELESAFMSFRFWVNWSSFDLFMIGLKKMPEPTSIIPTNWEKTVAEIDELMATINKSKICRYRSTMAKLAGDRWFITMRDVAKKIEFIHTM